MTIKKSFLTLVLFFPILASCNLNGNQTGSNSFTSQDKSKIYEFSFVDYSFAYFDDGSGALYSKETSKVLFETPDYTFNSLNINEIGKGDSLITLVEQIGFPRFLGVSSTYSLDFGYSNSDIYRIFFSNEMLCSDIELLDYNDPSTWIDVDKKDLPTLSDLENIEIGMSLDEVVSIIGKPQGEAGYGAIMFTFSIDDGSTLLTSWNPGEYDSKNEPYFLASLDLI